MKTFSGFFHFGRQNFLLLITASLFFSCVDKISAQEVKQRKNTIRFNITNPAIFTGNSFIVGYERVVGKHQSFTVSIGTAGFPRFSVGPAGDSVRLVRNKADGGFHIGADYRFYLAKENKYEAPRGVYIAPFYSFNRMSRGNVWDLNTAALQGTVETDVNFRIHTAGVALGYQFVFWNRLAIDLAMFGPGIGIYDFKTIINSTLPPEQQQLLYDKINSVLERRFPGHNFIIDENSLSNSGSSRTTTLGFRYNINIGFRF